MGNSTIKIRKLKEKKKKKKWIKVRRGKWNSHAWVLGGIKKSDFKSARWEIYSIVVFKIDVLFVLLKEKLPNNGTSENLE